MKHCELSFLTSIYFFCDTIGRISFRLCWRRSENLFWRETHTKGPGARSPARREVEEGRKIPEKTERTSWQRRAEETSRLEREVKRTRRTLSIKLSMVCGFCGSFVRVHTRTSSQNAQKVSHRLPPSCTWSWPKSVFVRLFFSSILWVVFCVAVKKCVMPLVGNERNH